MFSKNKRKIDSRIRFQNTRFKSKLHSARNYKRSARVLPKTDWEVFLSKIGLGSWSARIATLLVFFLLIYIVYIPNFLFIKNINITGLDAPTNASVTALVSSFLEKTLPWPQKNILLISKNKLKDYLLANDQKILSVNSVNKDFPGTLKLSITPRLDKFLIQTASSTNFSVSGDGIITAEVFPDASGTLPSSLVLIKLDNTEPLISGSSPLTKNTIDFVNSLQNQLPPIIGSPLSYYEMASLQTPDLFVFLKNGVELKFDLTSDLTKPLNSLRLLFSQFAASDIKNLYYIDMRFDGTGYVCYKNTVCAAETIIQSPTPSTTTLDNLPQ